MMALSPQKTMWDAGMDGKWRWSHRYFLNEVDLARTVNQDGTGTNPLQQPHYLIVNLAIGGTQGGDPSKTRFPARYEIDYVRVYQRRPSKE